MDPQLVFKGANLLVGALLIAGAVGNFIAHSFSSIIIGIYALVFGVITVALEVINVPHQYSTIIHKYASFFYSFGGRGIFYLLAGVLLLNHYTLLYISGSVVGFAGIVFFVLEFLPMFQPPASMAPPNGGGGYDQESQPVWSADPNDI